jgi:hypothetical protein
MDTDIKKRVHETLADYKKSQQQAPGRFQHFTNPEDWKQHLEKVKEAQKDGAPF